MAAAASNPGTAAHQPAVSTSNRRHGGRSPTSGNQTSIAAVGILLGVVFLLSAINEAGLAALAPGGWKVWHYILAAIFFLGALWGFIRPVTTFFALASVLGLILLFYGTFEIIQGVASRPVNPYWWVNLITGILLLPRPRSATRAS